jgi:hypothetical protein
MRQPTPDYIVEFMEEVYPNASELALSMFDEQTVLRDATTVIRESREEIARLREIMQHVWDTIPAAYYGPAPEAHARALNNLGTALRQEAER